MTQSNNVSLREKAAIWYNNLSYQEAISKLSKYGHRHDSLTIEIIQDIYLQEHPTEAEVSKEEETVEQAAMKYENRFHKIDEMGETICGYLTTDRPALKECFAHGAAWQKEKDRELIEELLSALKRLNNAYQSDYEINPDMPIMYSRETNNNAHTQAYEATTKAEQHLKNN